MSVDFNREVDRRSTSDVKWRPEGLKGVSSDRSFGK